MEIGQYPNWTNFIHFAKIIVNIAEKCDCQMVVMLVYKENQNPITLVVHGQDQMSWFTLVNAHHQPVDHRLEELIQDALKGQSVVTTNLPKAIRRGERPSI